MAILTTKTLDQLLQDMAAAVQGAAAGLVDLQVGSILRAVLEAFGAVVLWLQGLILALLATTRAATSTGADLDSWLSDYGFTRLPAQPATGLVTFARFSTGLQALIPVGAIVQTANGAQRYSVQADTTSAAYSAILGGFVVASSTASLAVPVRALTAGAAGNIAIGGVSVLSTAIPGIDTVGNAAAFDSGADAETDDAARQRFVDYINSLSKSTPEAVSYALEAMQQGISHTLTENFDYAGTYQPGYFYVVVDDGSGAPSTAFTDAAYLAIEAVRPVGATFGVFGPVLVTANVALTIATDPAYDHAALVGIVGTAVADYINGLGLGASLYYSRLPQVAYDASQGVVNVSGVTLGGGTADMAATAKQRIMAGTVAVS